MMGYARCALLPYTAAEPCLKTQSPQGQPTSMSEQPAHEQTTTDQSRASAPTVGQSAPDSAPRDQGRPTGRALASERAASDNASELPVAPQGAYADLDIPVAVEPSSVPDDAPLDHTSLYFNKELSWIDFNWRVLAQAMDERTPLLERVKFVAITANNLDEFVQKRIGGLKRQKAARVTQLSTDGRTPTEQLAILRPAVETMMATMTAIWEDELRPRLAESAHIVIHDYADLSAAQRAGLQSTFRNEIYPALTPLAVDAGHPFPFISNLSMSLAVTLRDDGNNSDHFVRLKLPRDRWLPVPRDPDRSNPLEIPEIHLVPLEQVVVAHIDELFPGATVTGASPFRITRNADVAHDDEEAEDLVEMIAAELRERRFAPVVRLEIQQSMPDHMQTLLRRELGLDEGDVYPVAGLLDLTDLFGLMGIHRPHLQDPAWDPVTLSRLKTPGGKSATSIFQVLRQGDLLVHHPYESFSSSTARFIREAADDPQVIAIKQTLYRTSDDSPIINALIDAANKGKQVAVLVEVTARFDEKNNIEWGSILSRSGVHVAYGIPGLKTHTKATLVVRREQGELKTYSHIGTGNYNSKTARLYTDLGLLTARPELGRDLVRLFHFLTGYAPGQEYETVLVAPRSMRDRFESLIAHEIERQALHGDGRIIVKINGLDDRRMIQQLYTASQAGVQIDLIIRGHCTLRPGLPGYSENIRVTSILGRFLEHDRIYYFHNGGEPVVLIGSADWRARNLNRRVELIAPVEEAALKQRLIDLLAMAMDDNRLAWEMDADGRYRLRVPANGEEERNLHQRLMDAARASARQ